MIDKNFSKKKITNLKKLKFKTIVIMYLISYNLEIIVLDRL